MRYGLGGHTPGSDAFPGQGGTADTGGAGATSGLRARNLGNIGFFGQHDPGLLGPSNSRDVDHSIALFATHEHGKARAYYTPEMIDQALSGKGSTTAIGP